MFGWYPYARPIALELWQAFVVGADFAEWEGDWEKDGQESPMDFFIEDKRARFQVRAAFRREFSLLDADMLAAAATKAGGRPVAWLRIDNSKPLSIAIVTFELSRLRTNVKGFKEVSA